MTPTVTIDSSKVRSGMRLCVHGQTIGVERVIPYGDGGRTLVLEDGSHRYLRPGTVVVCVAEEYDF